LLAQAHRGFLYVDEVNLLPDHLVDTLLDVAAMGVNYVEREGVSFSHPARFVLVGTMNPEEGELRPQLLDRFGLCVTVEGLREPAKRVEILKRWEEFVKDPEAFKAKFARETAALVERISAARRLLPRVQIPEEILYQIAKKTITLGVDGHRADLTMAKCARAHAAFYGREVVSAEDVRIAERLSIPHRLRRRPFEEIAGRMT
ncbi:MAG: magnesium chelatase ATPase subunit I, partial [Thermodesulfobacteria bacterium]|nr:magnesium chelatase ATPase subunit I [Thermodesulfobacteriota bacterium]